MDWLRQLLDGRSQLDARTAASVANLLERQSQLYMALSQLAGLRAARLRGEDMDRQIKLKGEEIAAQRQRIWAHANELAESTNMPLSVLLEVVGVDAAQIGSLVGKLGDFARGLFSSGSSGRSDDDVWSRATRH